MTIDLAAAASFMATHARALDRRRFEALFAGGGAGPVLGALEAYRNPDGGYGWGLEPDLRSSESQPGGALHAFEAIVDVAPATTPRSAELCAWLERSSLPDGGLPFALPLADPAGVAPFWARWDPQRSSLQITAYVAAMAHRVAEHDRAVAEHPWLSRATRFCVDAIAALEDRPHALVVTASLWFADALHRSDPGAADPVLQRLGPLVPPDGVLRVEGGAEDEAVRPLDLAPAPDGPVRALFDDDVIAADLERLAGGQHDDGGWSVDFDSYSPAAALEWRGHTTVRALTVLRAHGLI